LIVGGTPFVAEDWRQIIFTNNLLTSSAAFTQIRPPAGVKPSDYLWNFNRYFGTASFGTGQKFSDWNRATGLDPQSQWNIAPTPSVQIVVRPNRYESNRAHIVVLNWARTNAVQLNVEGLLKPG